MIDLIMRVWAPFSGMLRWSTGRDQRYIPTVQGELTLRRKEGPKPVTVNDLLAPLVVITALRVSLPDVLMGMMRPLRAGARVGIAELLGSEQAPARGGLAAVAVASRDAEV
ncbi:hypothetical protein [Streptomyces sp. NPDC046859]|uniref:hypothetical protein n=1 Tax=Streptomyces sp. NPDC046859 TaxID=3155734 RepID=UPI0033FAFCD3